MYWSPFTVQFQPTRPIKMAISHSSLLTMAGGSCCTDAFLAFLARYSCQWPELSNDVTGWHFMREEYCSVATIRDISRRTLHIPDKDPTPPSPHTAIQWNSIPSPFVMNLPASLTPVHDPKYYFPDGNTIILVETTLFKVRIETGASDQNLMSCFFDRSISFNWSRTTPRLRTCSPAPLWCHQRNRKENPTRVRFGCKVTLWRKCELWLVTCIHCACLFVQSMVCILTFPSADHTRLGRGWAMTPTSTDAAASHASLTSTNLTLLRSGHWAPSGCIGFRATFPLTCQSHG